MRLRLLRRVLAGVVIAGAALPAQAPTPLSVAAPLVRPQDMARALRVLRRAPVIDGHNDLPWRIREDSLHPHDVAAYDLRGRAPGMTDIARLKQGHVGGQFWSV